jgi:hypothetical protein
LKLLAGVDAWRHAKHTWNLFTATSISGGFKAIGKVAYAGRWRNEAHFLLPPMKELRKWIFDHSEWLASFLP